MSGYVVKEKRIEKAEKICTVLKGYLKKDISGFKILDIGTGTGEIANYLARDNIVYSVDVEKQINMEHRLFHFKTVEGELLPFKDNTFDIIISNHVIEHVNNSDLHLAECYRVLKGGRGMLLCNSKPLFYTGSTYENFFIALFSR